MRRDATETQTTKEKVGNPKLITLLVGDHLHLPKQLKFQFIINKMCPNGRISPTAIHNITTSNGCFIFIAQLLLLLRGPPTNTVHKHQPTTAAHSYTSPCLPYPSGWRCTRSSCITTRLPSSLFRTSPMANDFTWAWTHLHQRYFEANVSDHQMRLLKCTWSRRQVIHTLRLLAGWLNDTYRAIRTHKKILNCQMPIKFHPHRVFIYKSTSVGWFMGLWHYFSSKQTKRQTMLVSCDEKYWEAMPDMDDRDVFEVITLGSCLCLSLKWI